MPKKAAGERITIRGVRGRIEKDKFISEEGFEIKNGVVKDISQDELDRANGVDNRGKEDIDEKQ